MTVPRREGASRIALERDTRRELIRIVEKTDFQDLLDVLNRDVRDYLSCCMLET